MNLALPFFLTFIALAASPFQKSKIAKEPLPTAATVSFGKKTYMEYCAVCHGPDGRAPDPLPPR